MIGIFLDTEANGLNFYEHHLLEIAIEMIDLFDGSLIGSYQTTLYHTPEVWEKSDKNSLEVNGFTYEMIEKGKEISFVQKEIFALFEKHKIQRGKAVFICQNPSFDRIFFSQIIPPSEQEKRLWPYHWLDLASMHFALALHSYREEKSPLPWEIGLSKDNIARHYQIPPEKLPHRAMNGVKHLIECYKTVVGFPNEQKMQ